MTNETMKIWAHNHIYGKTYSELLHDTYSINQLAKKGLYPLYEYERVFDCIRLTLSDRMKELRDELEDLKGLEEFVESDYHEYCSNDEEDDEVILSEYELPDDEEDDEVILVHECNEDDEVIDEDDEEYTDEEIITKDINGVTLYKGNIVKLVTADYGTVLKKGDVVEVDIVYHDGTFNAKNCPIWVMGRDFEIVKSDEKEYDDFMECEVDTDDDDDDEKPYLWDITKVNRYEREHVGGITKMNK